MNTETTTEVKTPKLRANSRMALIVELFKAGTTDVESIASALKSAEEAGKIVGLKKTDDDFKSKKDLNFYKKVVNWYLNQAKHKKLIDAPISSRRLKSKKEVAAEVVAAAEVVTESVESTVDGIPTI
jgi:hypothetical protein